jgi:hypothetical protein
MFYLLPKAWKYPQRSPAQERKILNQVKYLLQVFTSVSKIENLPLKVVGVSDLTSE